MRAFDRHCRPAPEFKEERHFDRACAKGRALFASAGVVPATPLSAGLGEAHD